MSTATHDTFSEFAMTIYKSKYARPGEEWKDTVDRVAYNVLGALGLRYSDKEYKRIRSFMLQRKFIPGGRYLFAAGLPYHQCNNCLLLKAEDSREGWADLTRKATMALMTGAGIGIDYSAVRPAGSKISKTAGESSGPVALMKVINEIGRNVMQGGHRRSAIWAGLSWKHQDIFDFINIKNWSDQIKALKEKDFNWPAPLDMTNVSVILDNEFFDAYDNRLHPLHSHARDVYHEAVKSMLATGEPGFSIDVDNNAGETLRNACTEVVSYDDSDICNLGSINLARVEDLAELEEIVRYGVLFLLAGTEYSHVPYAEVASVRNKNRRIGLGLMGVHEWLISRGKAYGPDNDLAKWLDIYSIASRYWADHYANIYNMAKPKKVRAIAPTGTISIIGETTSGIEPIFRVAYRRRFRKANANGNDSVYYQYVVDPTAHRLINSGIHPSTIEDSYTLSYDVERRIKFQSWVQRWVDQGISSTINLPGPITDPMLISDYGDTLYRYLPQLRGITIYPDGARGGQPLVPASYDQAISNLGVTFEDNLERCNGSVCGD